MGTAARHWENNSGSGAKRRRVAFAGLLSLVLLAAWVAAPTPASASPAWYVSATITGVDGQPGEVAVNSTTHAVYVNNDDSSALTVISEATNTVTGSVADGSGEFPDAVAVDPGNDNVYMANTVGSDLAVFNGATNSLTATIPVGGYPDAVAVDTSTHEVYVTNGYDDTVSVIDESGDANTGKVVATVGVGEIPVAVEADTSTHNVYVVNEGGDSVSVISGSTDKVTATIAVGRNPEAVAVDSATHNVYVANALSNSVSVIDESGDADTGTVTEAISVPQFPQSVAVDPTTHNVYVASGSGPLAVIDESGDATNGTIIAQVSLAESVWVAEDTSNGNVYVLNADGNEVYVLSPATVPGAPTIGTATAGIGGAVVGFTPPASDGHNAITAYTVTASDTSHPANGGQTASGTTSPITVPALTGGDTYTFRVTATNTVGTGPPSGASNPVTVLLAQSITFSTSPPTPASYGSTYTPEATATSGMPVSFTIDSSSTPGACSIDGSGTVTFTGVGTCVVDANQGGDTAFAPAPMLSQTIAVGKGSQTITFTSTAPSDATVGGRSYTFGTTTSGLPVEASTPPAPGGVPATTRASPASAPAWSTPTKPATPTTRRRPVHRIPVGQGSQTITFTSTAPSVPPWVVPRTLLRPPPPRACPSASASTPPAPGRAHAGDRRGELHRRRHLRGRRQPSRQHRLPGGDPGAPDHSGGPGFTDDYLHIDAPSDATVGGPSYTPSATATSGLPVSFSIDASSTAGACSYAPATGAVASPASAPARSTPSKPATPTTRGRPRCHSPSPLGPRRSPSLPRAAPSPTGARSRPSPPSTAALSTVTPLRRSRSPRPARPRPPAPRHRVRTPRPARGRPGPIIRSVTWPAR